MGSSKTQDHSTPNSLPHMVLRPDAGCVLMALLKWRRDRSSLASLRRPRSWRGWRRWRAR